VGLNTKLTSSGAIQLESKESMKKRGVASPDVADALALTFSYPVANKETSRILRDKLLSTNGKRISGVDNSCAWML